MITFAWQINTGRISPASYLALQWTALLGANVLLFALSLYEVLPFYLHIATLMCCLQFCCCALAYNRDKTTYKSKWKSKCRTRINLGECHFLTISQHTRPANKHADLTIKQIENNRIKYFLFYSILFVWFYGRVKFNFKRKSATDDRNNVNISIKDPAFWWVMFGLHYCTSYAHCYSVWLKANYGCTINTIFWKASLHKCSI